MQFFSEQTYILILLTTDSTILLFIFLKYYDVNDLGLSDYEDELDKLRSTTEDHDYEQHPLSDLKLLQLVQAS